MKSLVIFYSFEGSTKLIGETIAQKIGAELLEIKPEKEIGSHGFMKYFWGGRQAMMKLTPRLVPFSKNFEEYDLLIIGTPVWAFDMTPAIRTFLHDYNFINKKVAIFCCYEGNMGKALSEMNKLLAGNQIIGQEDFRDVRKKEKENISKAENWSATLLN